MSFGGAENYLDSGEIEVLRSGSNVWVKAYNGTGSAIDNGKVKRIYIEAVTAATPDCARYTIAAPQTAATLDQRICVVETVSWARAQSPTARTGSFASRASARPTATPQRRRTRVSKSSTRPTVSSMSVSRTPVTFRPTRSLLRSMRPRWTPSPRSSCLAVKPQPRPHSLTFKGDDP